MKMATRVAIGMIVFGVPAWPLLGAEISGVQFKPENLSAPTDLDRERLNHPQPMTSQQYPWSAIGKIFRDDGRTCTGTMVAANLVLTAASCVTDSESSYTGRIRFYPNYRSGNGSLYSDAAQVVFPAGGYNPRNPATNWAIIRLNSNLGLKTGWLGWRIIPTMRNYRFAYAAYASDFEYGDTAGYYTNCLSLGEDRATATFDCSIGADEEGGPVFAEFDRQIQIVAMSTSNRRGEVDAVKTAAFAARLRELQDQGAVSAETYTHACNQAGDGSVFKVAVAFSETDQSFTSDGWYSVAPQQCVEIYLRDSQRQDISVFAAAEFVDQRPTLFDRSFCVMDSGEFRMANADRQQCSAPGERQAQFTKRLDGIGPGNLSIFEFR
jgi:protease YdgD